MAQIFVSHSKRDEAIRQFFDSAFASAGVRAVRMEFEAFKDRPSRQIINAIKSSQGLFVLLGPNVVASPYTENWVTFEVGVASGVAATGWRCPIWVFEAAEHPSTFPIPHLDHYMLYNLNDLEHQSAIRFVIEQFKFPSMIRSRLDGIDITCIYPECRSRYLLHCVVDRFRCPTCRQELQLDEPRTHT